MAKVINRGLLPPDHPIYSEGWTVLSVRSRRSTRSPDTSTVEDAPASRKGSRKSSRKQSEEEDKAASSEHAEA